MKSSTLFLLLICRIMLVYQQSKFRAELYDRRYSVTNFYRKITRLRNKLTKPVNTSVRSPKVMTKQEMYAFYLLRHDWTKEQMEELGLEKEVNELGGETHYFNDVVKYIYLDARAVTEKNTGSR